jgi:hypothetical protein
MSEHKFDETGFCSKCCCGPTECPECDSICHSYGVVDEHYDAESGDCWWIHEYFCEKCNKEFTQ